MGLSSLFNRAKAFAGRTLNSVGGTVKKIADFAAPVVRRVAELAKPVADGIAGVSLALGQPEIALLAKGVSKAADWIQGAAPKVQAGIDKAGAIGSRMQGLGQSLGG